MLHRTTAINRSTPTRPSVLARLAVVAAKLVAPIWSSSFTTLTRSSRRAHRATHHSSLAALYSSSLENRVMLASNPVQVSDIGDIGNIADLGNIPPTQVGNNLFFVNGTVETGVELWAVKQVNIPGGGFAETTELIKNIAPGPLNYNPQNLRRPSVAPSISPPMMA